MANASLCWKVGIRGFAPLDAGIALLLGRIFSAKSDEAVVEG